jgi:hypothetical protein
MQEPYGSAEAIAFMAATKAAEEMERRDERQSRSDRGACSMEDIADAKSALLGTLMKVGYNNAARAMRKVLLQDRSFAFAFSTFDRATISDLCWAAKHGLEEEANRRRKMAGLSVLPLTPRPTA